MAGHARFTALLDACVLYPAVSADALMSLAETGLYAAKWTQRIEQEWMGSLVRSRPELAGRLDVRKDLMREAAPDWEVKQAAWEPLEAKLKLPDPNDRHVLAAAVAGHADCIVTLNLVHFPAEVLGPFHIEPLHPDSFILAQWDLDPVAAMTAFKRMRNRWKKPQATALDFAAVFERSGMPATARRLEQAAELI